MDKYKNSFSQNWKKKVSASVLPSLLALSVKMVIRDKVIKLTYNAINAFTYPNQ